MEKRVCPACRGYGKIQDTAVEGRTCVACGGFGYASITNSKDETGPVLYWRNKAEQLEQQLHAANAELAAEKSAKEQTEAQCAAMLNVLSKNENCPICKHDVDEFECNGYKKGYKNCFEYNGTAGTAMLSRIAKLEQIQRDWMEIGDELENNLKTAMGYIDKLERVVDAAKADIGECPFKAKTYSDIVVCSTCNVQKICKALAELEAAP